MRFLVTAGFLLMAPVAGAEQIPGTQIVYGNWSGAAYTFDHDGSFSHCVVSAAYNHGNTLLFSVNGNATVNVGVISPSPLFTPDLSFPVALYVDRRPPFYGNAVALDETFAVLTITDLERALDSFRRGKILLVQSQFGDIPFDLTGTSRALAMVFDCAVQNSAYRAPTTAIAISEVDPSVLMQVATGNIAAIGATDFVFLSNAEISTLFPASDPKIQKVFWRSPSLGLLSGVMVMPRDAASDLKMSDANDLAHLAALCGGDFVTGVRQLPEMKVGMREIQAVCTTETTTSEHYMTKFFKDDSVIYSWLWFEGLQASTESAPVRKEMSESAALQTANYLAE